MRDRKPAAPADHHTQSSLKEYPAPSQDQDIRYLSEQETGQAVLKVKGKYLLAQSGFGSQEHETEWINCAFPPQC